MVKISQLYDLLHRIKKTTTKNIEIDAALNTFVNFENHDFRFNNDKCELFYKNLKLGDKEPKWHLAYNYDEYRNFQNISISYPEYTSDINTAIKFLKKLLPDINCYGFEYYGNEVMAYVSCFDALDDNNSTITRAFRNDENIALAFIEATVKALIARKSDEN